MRFFAFHVIIQDFTTVTRCLKNTGSKEAIHQRRNLPAFCACDSRVRCHRRTDQRTETLQGEGIRLLQDGLLRLRAEHRRVEGMLKHR